MYEDVVSHDAPEPGASPEVAGHPAEEQGQ